MATACGACGADIGPGEKILRFEDGGEVVVFRLKPHGCALKNPSKYPEKTSPAFRRKYESLVKKLKARGDVESPWAVATAALGGHPPRRNPEGEPHVGETWTTSGGGRVVVVGIQERGKTYEIEDPKSRSAGLIDRKDMRGRVRKNPSRARRALGKARKALTGRTARRIAGAGVAAAGIAASPEVGPEAAAAGIEAGRRIASSKRNPILGPMAPFPKKGDFAIADHVQDGDGRWGRVSDFREGGSIVVRYEDGSWSVLRPEQIVKNVGPTLAARRSQKNPERFPWQMVGWWDNREAALANAEHYRLTHPGTVVQVRMQADDTYAVEWRTELEHRMAIRAERERKNPTPEERYKAEKALRDELRSLQDAAFAAVGRGDEAAAKDAHKKIDLMFKRLRKSKRNPAPKEAERSLCLAYKELSKGRLGASYAREYAERALRQSGGEGPTAVAATRVLAALGRYYATSSEMVPDPTSVLAEIASRNPVVNGATVTRIEYTTRAGARYYHDFSEDPKFPAPKIRVKEGSSHDKLEIGPTTVRAAGIGAGQ